MAICPEIVRKVTAKQRTTYKGVRHSLRYQDDADSQPSDKISGKPSQICTGIRLKGIDDREKRRRTILSNPCYNGEKTKYVVMKLVKEALVRNENRRERSTHSLNGVLKNTRRIFDR